MAKIHDQSKLYKPKITSPTIIPCPCLLPEYQSSALEDAPGLFPLKIVVPKKTKNIKLTTVHGSVKERSFEDCRERCLS